jgi:hypothetical protein
MSLTDVSLTVADDIIRAPSMTLLAADAKGALFHTCDLEREYAWLSHVALIFCAALCLSVPVVGGKS